jgi:hypothetical protein
MLALNKQPLSWFILRRAPGGVTPSTIPYLTDENLTKVHRTPSVTCRPTLQSVSCSPWRTSRIPLGVDNGKRRHLHHTLNPQWRAGPPCGAYPVPLARTPWDPNLAWITRNTAPTSFIIVLVLYIHERLNLYMFTHLPRIRYRSD